MEIINVKLRGVATGGLGVAAAHQRKAMPYIFPEYFSQY